MAGDDVARLVDQHRRRPAPLLDAGGDLRHLGFAMGAGVPGIGDEAADRAALDSISGPGLGDVAHNGPGL